jgi:hypothetical protein
MPGFENKLEQIVAELKPRRATGLPAKLFRLVATSEWTG